MMTVGQYSSVEDDLLQAQLQPDTPQRLVASAASLLSQVSQFAGVISTPKRAEQQFFRQIEFLSLSAQRILVIVITPDGDVQNRLLHVAEPYTASQLVEAANYLNNHYAGIPLSQIQKTIKQELSHLQQRVADLMQAAISQPVQDATTQLEDALIVKGERHLLNVNELTSDMNRLRQTFHLFDEKTRLLQLLEQASTADGVQIFIGGESDVLPFDGVSIISAPYSANNQIIGTLGVIGPSRMAYDKMIPLVNVTAQILSRALSHTSTTTNIEY
jgi:heat-inducible transcriptional repressor